MKLILMVIAILLSLAASIYAVDENTYVQLTADGVIAMHKHKGDVAEMNRWISQTQAQYPEFMTASWQDFEANVAANPSEKMRIYNRVLENVKSRGYRAHVSGEGGGLTTIVIED